MRFHPLFKFDFTEKVKLQFGLVVVDRKDLEAAAVEAKRKYGVQNALDSIELIYSGELPYYQKVYKNVQLTTYNDYSIQTTSNNPRLILAFKILVQLTVYRDKGRKEAYIPLRRLYKTRDKDLVDKDYWFFKEQIEKQQSIRNVYIPPQELDLILRIKFNEPNVNIDHEIDYLKTAVKNKTLFLVHVDISSLRDFGSKQLEKYQRNLGLAISPFVVRELEVLEKKEDYIIARIKGDIQLPKIRYENWIDIVNNALDKLRGVVIRTENKNAKPSFHQDGVSIEVVDSIHDRGAYAETGERNVLETDLNLVDQDYILELLQYDENDFDFCLDPIPLDTTAVKNKYFWALKTKFCSRKIIKIDKTHYIRVYNWYNPQYLNITPKFVIKYTFNIYRPYIIKFEYYNLLQTIDVIPLIDWSKFRKLINKKYITIKFYTIPLIDFKSQKVIKFKYIEYQYRINSKISHQWYYQNYYKIKIDVYKKLKSFKKKWININHKNFYYIKFYIRGNIYLNYIEKVIRFNYFLGGKGVKYYLNFHKIFPEGNYYLNFIKHLINVKDYLNFHKIFPEGNFYLNFISKYINVPEYLNYHVKNVKFEVNEEDQFYDRYLNYKITKILTPIKSILSVKLLKTKIDFIKLYTIAPNIIIDKSPPHYINGYIIHEITKINYSYPKLLTSGYDIFYKNIQFINNIVKPYYYGPPIYVNKVSSNFINKNISSNKKIIYNIKYLPAYIKEKAFNLYTAKFNFYKKVKFNTAKLLTSIINRPVYNTLLKKISINESAYQVIKRIYLNHNLNILFTHKSIIHKNKFRLWFIYKSIDISRSKVFTKPIVGRYRYIKKYNWIYNKISLITNKFYFENTSIYIDANRVYIYNISPNVIEKYFQLYGKISIIENTIKQIFNNPIFTSPQKFNLYNIWGYITKKYFYLTIHQLKINSANNPLNIYIKNIYLKYNHIGVYQKNAFLKGSFIKNHITKKYLLLTSSNKVYFVNLTFKFVKSYLEQKNLYLKLNSIRAYYINVNLPVNNPSKIYYRNVFGEIEYLSSITFNNLFLVFDFIKLQFNNISPVIQNKYSAAYKNLYSNIITKPHLIFKGSPLNLKDKIYLRYNKLPTYFVKLYKYKYKNAYGYLNNLVKPVFNKSYLKFERILKPIFKKVYPNIKTLKYYFYFKKVNLNLIARKVFYFKKILYIRYLIKISFIKLTPILDDKYIYKYLKTNLKSFIYYYLNFVKVYLYYDDKVRVQYFKVTKNTRFKNKYRVNFYTQGKKWFIKFQIKEYYYRLTVAGKRVKRFVFNKEVLSFIKVKSIFNSLQWNYIKSPFKFNRLDVFNFVKKWAEITGFNRVDFIKGFIYIQNVRGELPLRLLKEEIIFNSQERPRVNIIKYIDFKFKKLAKYKNIDITHIINNTILKQITNQNINSFYSDRRPINKLASIISLIDKEYKKIKLKQINKNIKNFGVNNSRFNLLKVNKIQIPEYKPLKVIDININGGDLDVVKYIFVNFNLLSKLFSPPKYYKKTIYIIKTPIRKRYYHYAVFKQTRWIFIKLNLTLIVPVSFFLYKNIKDLYGYHSDKFYNQVIKFKRNYKYKIHPIGKKSFIIDNIYEVRKNLICLKYPKNIYLSSKDKILTYNIKSIFSQKYKNLKVDIKIHNFNLYYNQYYLRGYFSTKGWFQYGLTFNYHKEIIAQSVRDNDISDKITNFIQIYTSFDDIVRKDLIYTYSKYKKDKRVYFKYNWEFKNDKNKSSIFNTYTGSLYIFNDNLNKIKVNYRVDRDILYDLKFDTDNPFSFKTITANENIYVDFIFKNQKYYKLSIVDFSKGILEDQEKYKSQVKFVRELSNKNFIILHKDNLEDLYEGGEIDREYLNMIDGILKTKLFYDNNKLTPANARLKEINILKSTNKNIFVVDYTWDPDKIKDSYNKNISYGFIPSYTCKYENCIIDFIPNENSNDIYQLDQVNNFLYIPNNSTFNSYEEYINALSNNNFDMIIYNPVYKNEVMEGELNKLKYKINGKRRLVIGALYLSENINLLEYILVKIKEVLKLDGVIILQN